MKTSASKSPVEQFYNQQSSYITNNPYNYKHSPTTQYISNYQVFKIDHAYTLQNYRKLRLQQRQQLARLRMPSPLKRKFFDFKHDDDLRYQKPELVIFNHPFRGKMVMTKNQVEKQLERERKKMEEAQVRQKQGKVSENLLNEMGLRQQDIQIKRAQLSPQSSQQQEEQQKQFPQKWRNQPKLTPQKLADDINKKQAQKRNQNVFYIHKKNTGKQQTYKQKQERNIKVSKQLEQQGKRQKDYRYRQMPIIGEEPKVLRDVDRQTADNKRKGGINVQSNSKYLNKKLSKQKQLVPPKSQINSKKDKKEFYRHVDQQDPVRQISKNNYNRTSKSPQIQYIGTKGFKTRISEDNLIQKGRDGINSYTSIDQQNNHNQNNKLNEAFDEGKSLSRISAIPQNNVISNNDLSSSSSLNKALFLK